MERVRSKEGGGWSSDSEKERDKRRERYGESKGSIPSTWSSRLVFVGGKRSEKYTRWGSAALRLSESVSAMCHMTAVVCGDTLTTLQQTQETWVLKHTHQITAICRHIIPSHILSNDDTTPHPATGLFKKKEEQNYTFPPLLHNIWEV